MSAETDRSRAHLPESIGRYRVTGVLGEGRVRMVDAAQQDIPERLGRCHQRRDPTAGPENRCGSGHLPRHRAQRR